MDAFALLDYDCWWLVFQKLSGEELLSCRQVCKPFQKLLDEEEFQIKWKFHLILPKLVPYLKTRYAGGGVYWENLYSIRLACSSWRQSLDKYLSEAYEPTLFPDEMQNFPLVTRLETLEEIEKFQKEFGESGMNPFPSRTLYVEIPEMDEDNEDDETVQRFLTKYFEKVGDCVEHFGKHIFKLELHLSFDGPWVDHLSLCKFIRRITAHLINLKILLIGTGNYEDEVDKDREEREQGMALDWIKENPLQAMPKLKALQFFELDKTVENYLLDKYAHQLTQFERIPNRSLLQKDQVEKFRNLEKLSLELVDASDTLEILRFLESSLKFLEVSLYREDSGPWIVDKFLRNIKHLQQLECLKISLGTDARVDVEELGCVFEDYVNESIQTLKIDIWWGQENGGKVSFNFLQALTKLERLELILSSRVATTHPDNVDEIVELNEYLARGRTDKLYESNVWEDVPSLETLTVRRDRSPYVSDGYDESIYTREKYEKFRTHANESDI